MQNYRLKQKIIKTKAVTYYLAIHIQTNSPYIIKKLNKGRSWQQVLEQKSFSIIKNSKSKYFAKIKQIIKSQDTFYCVMEHSQINLTNIIANDIQRHDICKVAKQLVQLIVGLNDQKVMVRDLRPSHLFFNNSKANLRLYHFQTFSQKDYSQLDLTQIQDLRYISPEQVLTTKGFTQKCATFSIGLIISELILGQPLLKAKNKLQYIYQLTQLFPNQRIDKMNGSQHQFKQIQKGQTFIQKMKKQNIGKSFLSTLVKMLKIDHTQRISVDQLLKQFNIVSEQEQKDHRNKQLQVLQQKTGKNRIKTVEKQIQIQFDFETKATLSSIPAIFSSKVHKKSPILPQQANIQDDCIQPIIISQTRVPINEKRSSKKQVLHSLQDVNVNKFQSNAQNSQMMFNSSNYSSQSGLLSKMGKLGPINQNNELKGSKVTNQSVSATIRKPQLTNYALNQVNPGIKLGMNTIFFNDNQHQQIV